MAAQLDVATAGETAAGGPGLRGARKHFARVKAAAGGKVLVDQQLRTHNPRIWAAGDVTGHPQYVYVAAAHGDVAVDNAFDDAGRTVDYRQLPAVTFTTPALASAG